MFNWINCYFFRENNKISVFSVKVALATLCAGKLMDKFRCKSQIIFLQIAHRANLLTELFMWTDIYSQISDSNGHMLHWRFADYLKEVLALTAAVYESPSFGYSDGLANSIFLDVCMHTIICCSINTLIN